MTVQMRGAIPAIPLILDADRRVDWRHQRAVVRYHLASGVNGLAVGVHTTQFELHHDPALLAEVWQLVAIEAKQRPQDPVTLVAGVCGDVVQAVREAEQARELGYQAALLCANGMAEVSPAAILAKAEAVGEVLPTIGFYLQESVGGLRLPPSFWRQLVDIETCIAVKAAPFDRYRTRDVAQAILESDRWQHVALLTGNDDSIIADLVTPHRRMVGGQLREIRCAGGLLGQFSVGTRAAVQTTHEALVVGDSVSTEMLAVGQDLVEVNAAVFDVAHGFLGCVAGVNEVLRQQGLTPTALCLGADDQLSPGQSEMITQVRARFPELLDEEFITQHRDSWLA